MEKINLVELLKDCPKGMELDCMLFNNPVKLDEVADIDKYPCPITVITVDGNIETFTKYGQYLNLKDAKCVIFPKGKTTWEGFQRPFKDGDILVYKHKSNNVKYTFIYKRRIDMHCLLQYCGWFSEKPYLSEQFNVKERMPLYENDDIRFATEEEKQKLFDAIETNGYKWNAEAKTLEKLPEFKDGDIIFAQYYDLRYVSIVKQIDKSSNIHVYCLYGFTDSVFAIDEILGSLTENFKIRFATEEEKQKLFQSIKDNGYKWNPETKTLEKLPKFKVGNKIKYKDTILTIIDVKTNNYIVEDEPDHFGILMFSQQDKWELINEPKFKVGDKINKRKGLGSINLEIVAVTPKIYTFRDGSFQYVEIIDKDYELVPNKFDIGTLKPFESKVLVRNVKGDLWKPAAYGFSYSKGCYVVGGIYWKQCIPYKGNEYLLGKTNDCSDYYKTWKE